MEGSLVAYKVFTNGSVLNASEVNDNLMNQAVITFSNSAARASAITSPVEGMVTYLEDTDTYQFWNGSAWVAFGGAAGSGNFVQNGAFEINQRNFTSSTAGGFGFDRWKTERSGGTVTASSETFAVGSVPGNFEAKNFYRVVTSGQSASGDFAAPLQGIENVRTLAGQTATLSFYAKAGSGTPEIGIELEQNFGSGGSPSASVSTPLTAVTISTGWVRYTATVSVPSITGKTLGTNNNDTLNVVLWVSAGSDLDSRSSSIGIQNNTFDIWGVQLEAGSTATPFRRNANSLQGELAACQRYYIRFGGDASNEYFGNAIGESSTLSNAIVQYPVQMRVPPTSIDYSTLRVSSQTGNDVALTNVTLTATSTSTKVARLVLTSAGSITANRPYFFGTNGSTNGFLGFSAEL
jgi:hypothetical protein